MTESIPASGARRSAALAFIFVTILIDVLSFGLIIPVLPHLIEQFTSLTGIGIGLIPWVRSGFLKVLLPLVGLTGAILLHGAFNFTATVFGSVAYVVLFFVILLYAVIIIGWLALERRMIRDELREEVGAGTITAEEYSILPSYFRKTAYYLGLLFTGRFATWSRARKVHGAAVELAVSKRLARRADTAIRRDRVLVLRKKVGRVRGEAAAGTGA